MEEDEIPLPETNYLSGTANQMLRWFAMQLRAWVNNTDLDTHSVKKMLPYLMDIHSMLEKWVDKHGPIHPQDVDVKTMRHWWRLFMHLHGPTDGEAL